MHPPALARRLRELPAAKRLPGPDGVTWLAEG
jgi:hypothetical protein